MKVCALTGLSRAPPAETIARTKLASFVWEWRKKLQLGQFFGRAKGSREAQFRTHACKRARLLARLHALAKLCFARPPSLPKKPCPSGSGGVVFYGNWTCFVHYNIKHIELLNFFTETDIFWNNHTRSRYVLDFLTKYFFSWNIDLNGGTQRAWSVFHGESPWIFKILIRSLQA